MKTFEIKGVYVWAPLVGSASRHVFGTYSLETNSSGDGVENGVSVGEVGEAPRLDPFKVQGLKRESECRYVSFSLAFAATRGLLYLHQLCEEVHGYGGASVEEHGCSCQEA